VWRSEVTAGWQLLGRSKPAGGAVRYQRRADARRAKGVVEPNPQQALTAAEQQEDELHRRKGQTSVPRQAAQALQLPVEAVPVERVRVEGEPHQQREEQHGEEPQLKREEQHGETEQSH
jgi:hypothetical protein